ncbi:hypothetical protein ACVWXM_009659 [Bradyrhizobium sp. GM7.3]
MSQVARHVLAIKRIRQIGLCTLLYAVAPMERLRVGAASSVTALDDLAVDLSLPGSMQCRAMDDLHWIANAKRNASAQANTNIRFIYIGTELIAGQLMFS